MKIENDEKQQRDLSVKNWMAGVIKPDEITRYLKDGKDFIDDEKIERQIADGAKPDRQKIKDIIAKSLSIERLEPEETAALLNLKDNDLWDEIFAAAGEIKKRVYDNRIVTFAPFYCSNYCVNNCSYCGFRKENSTETRRRLTLDEIRNETKALVSMGHKRLIVVYGEHPSSDADYIAESLKTIYATKVGNGEIRRANVNAAPMSIEQLKMLGEIGLGTYQVFQETYHHKTYQ
ncbi:MAG: radical SAM protein, partial [Planctomycetes bacterium]|nr:radical SAM protein [Planctomycetota bacterium]